MENLAAATLAALSTLVGARVRAAEPGRWGFENQTTIVTLHDGRRLVLQQLTQRARAPEVLRLARLLPERLAGAGVRLPQLISANADAHPPYAVREYIPGQPGALLLESDAGARQLAEAMGALLRRLPLVDTGGLGLPRLWASTERLSQAARVQLWRCGAMLSPAAYSALDAVISELPAQFAGRGGYFAHGDFCPVNALVAPRAGGALSCALIDTEFARLADPLFDAAWWGWVVRHHHPERWRAAWPTLLAAAGIRADAPTLARLRSLQLLRCLEHLDSHSDRPAEQADWARRCSDTADWT